MFQFARTVELEASSEDRSVLDALEDALAYQHLTRDLIPDQHDGRPLDLSFASEQWQRLVRPRRHWRIPTRSMRIRRAELPRPRAGAPVRVRAADQDPQLEGPHFLPARPRDGLPPYRSAVRRAGPERDRLAADPDALAGSDADCDLDPGGPPLLDAAAPSLEQRVAAKQPKASAAARRTSAGVN